MLAGALATAPAVGRRGVLAVLYLRSSWVLHGCMSGCVSNRKKYAAQIEHSNMAEHIRLGSRYGNLPNIPLGEKTEGKV
jgi:hypothetical protein